MADPSILHGNIGGCNRLMRPDSEESWVFPGEARQAGPHPLVRSQPALGEKNFSNLPSTPLNSSASAGASFLRVMFGHWPE